MSSGKHWLVVGGGNMASALIGGACRAGVLEPSGVIIAELDVGKHAGWRSMGCVVVGGAGEGYAALRSAEGERDGGVVLLAVKPQGLASVGAALSPVLMGSGRLVVSILAGVRSATVKAAMGGTVRVARVMPNLGASVGEGAAAWWSEQPDPHARAVVASVSPVVIDLEETLFDAFTAVGGSGPAYLFALAEAMIGGGVRAGLSPEDADRVVRQTLRGAALMLWASGEAPGALRSAVTSKGGTTAAALTVLEAAAWGEAMSRAVVAARDRGRELGA
ncbi:MAG: NAD(P)-binding domain-containing protein [Phycisphaeraceae bacterium]|nr:MAG: NAD(P)-binding domain-containing protein [Phycisphaeraceae bacterium]